MLYGSKLEFFFPCSLLLTNTGLFILVMLQMDKSHQSKSGFLNEDTLMICLRGWNVILRYIYQQQGCGSSHAQISTRFEGGNDKNVQCGPPISSAMMHEDCQSENTG
ncbi:hypothetical protein D8674_042998 [Pyrus ussuriensis x Pyrus communis]|uniref:Uncharacterized protein n=1 Tax=Pyrus ussuriensis x Pyrus communis TaxID=2448454 RepID=A0A5N5H1Y6_9ROSA|nr:hypothetical protein D8674_042998 [Pyrus ussuriensis x Pyrus communis]